MGFAKEVLCLHFYLEYTWTGCLDELKDLGIGCYIEQYFCEAAGYADDIILLCPTSAGLRKIIEICQTT